MRGGFCERTTAYTYLPDPLPVIRALRHFGQTLDAAKLSDDAAADRWVLCTVARTAEEIDRLSIAFEEALKSDPGALGLARCWSCEPTPAS
jgi:hypothetical protein